MLRRFAGPFVLALLAVPPALEAGPPADRPQRAADLTEDFLEAAKKGDVAAVKALLARGADVNAKSAYGVTALAFAADRGHVEVVKLLIAHKADVNARDRFYMATPLTWALSRGHADVIKALIQAGAQGADQALTSAASTGQASIVRAVLETGKVKPAALSKALAATPADQTEVVELLKKAGAKPPAAPAVVLDAATLAGYAGTYRAEQGVEVTIAAEGGKLVESFGGQKLVLDPVDKVTFKLAASDTATLRFQREAGKVVGFTFKAGTSETVFKRVEKAAAEADARDRPALGPAPAEDRGAVAALPANWPQFRGPGGSGVADGQAPPITWDFEKGTNVRWKRAIPGLGNACPVVWGDRVFVATAVSLGRKQTLRAGQYGDVEPVHDASEHSWRVYCLDRRTGAVLWERTARQEVPQVKRHPKSTHANCTPAADAGHVVVSFGSEGLYCYDHAGKFLWARDLGPLASGWFYDADYQWGFGSSPILYKDLVIVQCDVGKGSFLAAYDVGGGREVWRTPREEVPSWGTPAVVEGPAGPELVANATRFTRGYDPRTGKELWRLGRHSEITVPTPVAGWGLVFVTDGYRPVQPIYAIRPGARGDLTLKEGMTSSDAIAWSTEKGGPYMPTPIVYGEYLYVCSNGGIVTCYEGKTGKPVYKERLGGRGGYTASPVAADGRLYFTGEENGVRVVQAGPKFKLLAVNPVGEVCMATPAISGGLFLLRTQDHLYALGRPEADKKSVRAR
jgi:outer membrane protein assembly factor BamB